MILLITEMSPEQKSWCRRSVKVIYNKVLLDVDLEVHFCMSDKNQEREETECLFDTLHYLFPVQEVCHWQLKSSGFSQSKIPKSDMDLNRLIFLSKISMYVKKMYPDVSFFTNLFQSPRARNTWFTSFVFVFPSKNLISSFVHTNLKRVLLHNFWFIGILYSSHLAALGSSTFWLALWHCARIFETWWAKRTTPIMQFPPVEIYDWNSHFLSAIFDLPWNCRFAPNCPYSPSIATVSLLSTVLQLHIGYAFHGCGSALVFLARGTVC